MALDVTHYMTSRNATFGSSQIYQITSSILAGFELVMGVLPKSSAKMIYDILTHVSPKKYLGKIYKKIVPLVMETAGPCVDYILSKEKFDHITLHRRSENWDSYHTQKNAVNVTVNSSVFEGWGLWQSGKHDVVDFAFYEDSSFLPSVLSLDFSTSYTYEEYKFIGRDERVWMEGRLVRLPVEIMFDLPKDFPMI
jgi:hypothetical protein